MNCLMFVKSPFYSLYWKNYTASLLFWSDFNKILLKKVLSLVAFEKKNFSQSCTFKFLSQNESGIKHIFFAPEMESTKV